MTYSENISSFLSNYSVKSIHEIKRYAEKRGNLVYLRKNARNRIPLIENAHLTRLNGYLYPNQAGHQSDELVYYYSFNECKDKEYFIKIDEPCKDGSFLNLETGEVNTMADRRKKPIIEQTAFIYAFEWFLIDSKAEKFLRQHVPMANILADENTGQMFLLIEKNSIPSESKVKFYHLGIHY